MTIALESVVPWGRSFDEYRRMFGLTERELELRILGCADGPAAFNAEATKRGYRVVSADPLYEFDAPSIRSRIDATYETVLEQTRANSDKYLWDVFAAVDDLGRCRMDSMRKFLDDYPAGRKAGRYVAASLPELPFADGDFDLCLCSHFLFLYETKLDYDFHISAVKEMLRVADEVRIFPLLTLDSKPSAFAPRIIAEAVKYGWKAQTQRVNYEFQRGGNTMMVLTHA